MREKGKERREEGRREREGKKGEGRVVYTYMYIYLHDMFIVSTRGQLLSIVYHSFQLTSASSSVYLHSLQLQIMQSYISTVDVIGSLCFSNSCSKKGVDLRPAMI